MLAVTSQAPHRTVPRPITREPKTKMKSDERRGEDESVGFCLLMGFSRQRDVGKDGGVVRLLDFVVGFFGCCWRCCRC